MKAAAWEPSPGSLLAFLNTGAPVFMADLYTFTLAGGAVYRYTSGDTPLTVNGATFGLGPMFERSAIRTTVGVEVDTLSIDVAADTAVMLGSVSFINAAANGLLDNGFLRVERAFLDDAFTLEGTIYLFSGRVGSVETERGRARIEALAQTELLSVNVPTGVYQPACRNTLYDANCAAVRATYKVTKAATSSTDAGRSSFTANFTASIAATAGYLDLGVATCVTGLNAGVSRTIKRQTGAAATSAVEVIAPWPFAVGIGDTFDFYAGCDKRQTTCSAKFANLSRFAAEPYIPQPDTVV